MELVYVLQDPRNYDIRHDSSEEKTCGAEDGSGQDWMGGYTRWPEAYLVTLADRCSFLFVSGQRGTIAKSMDEEHLCVVALTSMVRRTQFFPLASYRLV